MYVHFSTNAEASAYELSAKLMFIRAFILAFILNVSPLTLAFRSFKELFLRRTGFFFLVLGLRVLSDFFEESDFLLEEPVLLRVEDFREASGRDLDFGDSSNRPPMSLTMARDSKSSIECSFRIPFFLVLRDDEGVLDTSDFFLRGESEESVELRV